MKELKGQNLLWISAILILGVCAGIIYSCGGKNLEALDPSGQKVVFWYQHTDEREAVLQELIAEFNRTNSYGIEVQGLSAGDYEDIYNKMRLAIQEGGLPQLTVAYRYQAQLYYERGKVVDLAPYMDSPRWGLKPEERADYVQAFLEGDNVRQVQVAFRPYFSMELIYYNADWLAELGYDAPPRTWEQFADICRLAAGQPFSRSVDPGRSLGLMLEADASRLASMVFSRGGDFMNAWRQVYTLNTPQMRNSLKLVRQLADEGVIELFTEPHQDRLGFARGQVLFAICSSARISLFRHAIENSGTDFTWDIAPLPSVGLKPVINIYGASLAVCRSTPEQQLASWLFIKWFTQPTQQNRWVQGSNYFPVRKSAAPELVDYFRTAFELLEYGKSEPSAIRYENVRNLIENALVKIVDGADMDQVLVRLEQEANQTLK